MPYLFEGCNARTNNRVVTCCLNARGNGQTCAPCGRCEFRKIRRGRRYHCKNTTCMMSSYCWIHTFIKYGVKLFNSEFGKGLQATKDFVVGEFVAPLGGKPVDEYWEDIADEENTAVYGYKVEVLREPVTLHRRPGEFGFRLERGRSRRHPDWPISDRPLQRDQDLRVGVTVYRQGRVRQYLVHNDQWHDFLVTKRNQGGTLNNLYEFPEVEHARWDYNQFEAYVESDGIETADMDASCLRDVGSYANDSSVIAPDMNAGQDNEEYRSVIQRRNRANTKLAKYNPYPLRPEPSGWLVAYRPIEAGAEINVHYGRHYWERANEVKYGLKRVKANRTFAVENEPKGRRLFADEGTPCQLNRRRQAH